MLRRRVVADRTGRGATQGTLRKCAREVALGLVKSDTVLAQLRKALDSSRFLASMLNHSVRDSATPGTYRTLVHPNGSKSPRYVWPSQARNSPRPLNSYRNFP